MNSQHRGGDTSLKSQVTVSFFVSSYTRQPYAASQNVSHDLQEQVM